MLAVGVSAGVLTAVTGAVKVAPVVGWGAACAAYVLAVWRVVHRLDADGSRDHAQAEDPSQLVLWHVLDTEHNERHRELLDMAVLYPDGAIASDAMPWSMPDGSTYTGDAWPLPEEATSHPRSAGCFTRFELSA